MSCLRIFRVCHERGLQPGIQRLDSSRRAAAMTTGQCQFYYETPDMIRQERGFSLVELMITIVIFIMVIAASSQIFTALLTQFKQQSKIGETDIEGTIGLDILRRDLANTGFGLPGNMNGVQYAEAVDDSALFWNDRDLNDGPPENPARGTDAALASNPPGALRGKNNQGIHNADAAAGAINVALANSVSDVLVIKGTNVGMSDSAQRWTYITNTGALPNVIKGWGTGAGAPDNFRATDRVVVMKPDPNGRVNILQKSGTDFYTNFGSIDPATASGFQPTANSYESFVMYGVDPNSTPRMPFNRADYYVKRPAGGMPGRCAPRTGILYKSTINNDVDTSSPKNGGKHAELPILDCVADMQVKFCVDTSATPNPAAPTLTIVDADYFEDKPAADIRARLKDVQVYIVAQEGQRDANYDFSNNDARFFFSPIAFCGTATAGFDTVDFRNLVCGPAETAPNCIEYKRYHWRLYTIVSKPTSLR